MAFHGEGACLIQACCQLGDEYACLVVPVKQMKSVSPTTLRWKQTGALVVTKPDILAPARSRHVSGADEIVSLGFATECEDKKTSRFTRGIRNVVMNKSADFPWGLQYAEDYIASHGFHMGVCPMPLIGVALIFQK